MKNAQVIPGEPEKAKETNIWKQKEVWQPKISTRSSKIMKITTSTTEETRP